MGLTILVGRKLFLFKFLRREEKTNENEKIRPSHKPDFLLLYSREWDSNPRPTHYECVALPTEPSRQVDEPHGLVYL